MGAITAAVSGAAVVVSVAFHSWAKRAVGAQFISGPPLGGAGEHTGKTNEISPTRRLLADTPVVCFSAAVNLN